MASSDAAETDAMELHSFFTPGLPATDEPYTLKVKQAVSSSSQTLAKESCMKFIVDAPRFTIPAEDIHSVYPVDGVAEQPRVLPHIILNDPQLPWERVSVKNQPEESKKKYARPPWLALMVFTNEELQVAQLPGSTEKVQSSSTRALVSTVAHLAQADQAQNSFRCPNLEKAESTEDSSSVSYILLSKERFQTLISHQDNDAAPVNLDRFQHFSHVRVVSVEGSSHAADSTTPGNHPFGVVFSHRTGPVDVKEPQTVFVHLLSLDGISDNLKQVPLKATDQQIALVSLYSWTYRVAPADHTNYHEVMQKLNDTKQPLRRPDSLIANFLPATDPSIAWLTERLRHGYTWIRHHTMSGEATMGLYRGPLTPRYVTLGRCEPTVSGRSLQILDSQAGVIDLSYSIAWELGRNLAIADKGFTAAMLRLRTDICAMAVNGGTQKAKSTFQELGKTRDAMQGPGEQLYSGVYRWVNMVVETASETNKRDPPAGEAVLINALQDDVRKNLTQMAAQQFLSERSSNEKSCASTDWLLVLQWVKKKLALQDIPYVYLFPDPAVLPMEALRTFYVDENWTDALIDGALSIANHSTLENDPVKREIRLGINHYLSQAQEKPSTTDLSWRPRWGLVMRSKVVEAFPNLRIARALQKGGGASQNPEKPAAFVTLAADTLIYYQPDTPEVNDDAALVISQPFHHQRFSIGDELDDTTLSLSFKIFGQVEADKRIEGVINEAKWASNGSEAEFKCSHMTEGQECRHPLLPLKLKSIYNWKTRCLDVEALIDACKKVNEAVMAETRDPNTQEDSSAYMGLQLNDELLMLRLAYPAREGNKDAQPGGQKRMLHGAADDLIIAQPSENADSKRNRLNAPQFIPEPSSINTELLPPAQGFNHELLGQAVVTTAGNDPSYNNLLPLTTSQLTKVCFPKLPQSRRHFPAGGRITLDIIFSINAIPDVRQDIYLQSLTVYIPVGRVNTNLLLPLQTRPRMQMVGPGRYWILKAAQVTGKRHRLNLDGTWTAAGDSDHHDQKWLAITVSAAPKQNADGSRREGPLHLIRHPQLSFILHEMELNPLPCERIPLLVEEHYCRTTDDEPGVYDSAGTVRTVVGVTKQRCEWK